ncbi:hypothetical protein [Amycolatopsis magusensis]
MGMRDFTLWDSAEPVTLTEEERQALADLRKLETPEIAGAELLRA